MITVTAYNRIKSVGLGYGRQLYFHKFYIFFSVSGEITNSHMYTFPKNNLYSYNMIADSLRKIHISENREEITVQRLIYQRVN